MTSLCFVEPPQRALTEMWRVCRRGVIIGLLNRRSLLYYREQGRGGYSGARWDNRGEVGAWCASLQPRPRVVSASCVFLPQGEWLARRVESLIPMTMSWGGFLAVALHKPGIDPDR